MVSERTRIDNSVPTKPSLDRVGVVIPTYNAERHWDQLEHAIDRQGIACSQVLIIDSSSTDRTRTLAQQAGYQLMRISQSEFSHGGTRQKASEALPWADILLYLTQDALPVGDDAFRQLCAVFADPTIGAAFGRQQPRLEAGAIERHARVFNYPQVSSIRTFASRLAIGIKAAFLSNSFSAYRRSALVQAGGFPSSVIMAEDSYIAARLLLAGWKVAYVAEANVIHSHPLTFRQEFSRYFDTGVHHAHEPWILSAFGDAGHEGKRFLRSELAYLAKHKPSLIPIALLRTASKFTAYHLGLHERYVLLSLKTKLSCQPGFWLNSPPRSPKSTSSAPLILNSMAERAESRP